LHAAATCKKKKALTPIRGEIMKRRQTMARIGAFTVGLLLLSVASLPVHGQSRNADTQAMIVVTFGLLSPRLLSALNLTPEQAAKIEVIKKTLGEAQKAYLRDVIPLRTEVADKLFGPNAVREADVARQITKIADLREKILREGARLAVEVRNVLRPDQLAKAAAIRQQLLEIQNEVRGLYNENQ
jgi:Spy/CpxP family protein refolding chaperone